MSVFDERSIYKNLVVTVNSNKKVELFWPIYRQFYGFNSPLNRVIRYLDAGYFLQITGISHTLQLHFSGPAISYHLRHIEDYLRNISIELSEFSWDEVDFVADGHIEITNSQILIKLTELEKNAIRLYKNHSEDLRIKAVVSSIGLNITNHVTSNSISDNLQLTSNFTTGSARLTQNYLAMTAKNPSCCETIFTSFIKLIQFFGFQG